MLQLNSRSKKVFASLVLLLSATSLATMGAFATFTDSAAVSQTVGSGTIDIELGATGAATNRLNIGASGLIAGDTLQRAVNVINAGATNFGSITLTTTATTSSLLDTNATQGLQMVIEKCSQAWTEGGTAPAYTYTCGGSTTTVLASRAVIGSALALSNLTLTAGATNHLRVTLTLPSTSDLQGHSSTIQYSFDAIQAAAGSK